MNWLSDFDARLIRFARAEFAPTTARWHATIRMLFASTVVMLITQVFQLNQGYWAIITIMVICLPSVDSSANKMMERIAATIAGASVAYIVMSVFYQQYWFYLAALYALLLLAGLVIARSTRPYIGWVFALSLLVVALESRTGFRYVAQISFERMWVVAIGVGVSWIALALIFPANPIMEFRRKYTAAIDIELQRIEWILRRLRHPEQSATDRPPRSTGPSDARELFVFLGDAGYSQSRARQHLGALVERVTVVCAIGTITSNTIAAVESIGVDPAQQVLRAPSIQLMESLRDLLYQLRRWAQGDREAESDLVATLETSPIDLAPIGEAVAAFAVVHETEIVRLGIREGSGASCGTAVGLMATLSMCRAFHRTYAGAFAVGDGSARSVERAAVLRMISTPLLTPGLNDDSSRSFWFGIKMATACVVGFLFVSVTGFSSLGTMMITPLMVVGATGGSSESTRQRANLRAIGAALGAAVSILAIIFLIPTVDSIPGLLLIWIGCSAPFFWIMNGSTRISYAGVQGTFCLALAIGTHFEPTIDLAVPSGRIVGVILGTIVTYALFRWVKPDFARNELVRIYALVLKHASTAVTIGLPRHPGTEPELAALRFQSFALLLRSRNMSKTLLNEPRAREPAISLDHIDEIADHLTLIGSTCHALALNRMTAGFDSEAASDELHELYACANAVHETCLIASDCLEHGGHGEHGGYKPFATAAHNLDLQTRALAQLAPEIRARPSVRVLTAADAEFVLGQIGLYRVAATRLVNLASLLEEIAANRATTTSPQQGLPVRCALSSTA